jgi:hypothetical protein
VKVYAINTGGYTWKGAIFKTKKLAIEYLLRSRPVKNSIEEVYFRATKCLIMRKERHSV